MSSFILAAYTFALFHDRYESERISGFRDAEPGAFAAIEQAPGFLGRSGYEGDEGPKSWGKQVFPRFWVDNGDGFAPSTLSLWETPEALAAATYHGRHGAAFRRGREWNVLPVNWPGYVLWWVDVSHRPDWTEAVARHEHLADHGDSAHAFSFKALFDPHGQPLRLDNRRTKSLGANLARS
ncbi:DUF3291 domain-containing protein [Roseibium sp.]|uniref:DUF3291 domain-containing protein n=1 Tax=Roseibium sp. TaxID=1936156 RepID=UPI003A96DD38